MLSIINKNFKETRYTFEGLFSREMLNDKAKGLIEEAHNNYYEEKEKLRDKCRECEDLLNMCDTYEEKEAILRTYKMIKEKAMYN